MSWRERSDYRTRQKKKFLGLLKEVEDISYRVRAALEFDVSEDAGAEFVLAARKAFRMADLGVEEYLLPEHNPETWKFQSCALELKVPRRRCRGRKPDGKPCCLAAKPGSVFCNHHQGQDSDWSTVEGFLSELPPEP